MNGTESVMSQRYIIIMFTLKSSVLEIMEHVKKMLYVKI